jgi:acetyl-CoA carboxylase biotin carboxylase subunit
MYEGWTVPVEYDPLLAKLIAYGNDRQQCIGRLLRGLTEYMVGGIKTNLSLFRRILENPEFQAGHLDTGFLDRLLQEGPVAVERDEEGARVAALAAGIFIALGTSATSAGESRNDGERIASATERSGWKQAGRIEGTKLL